MIFQHNTARVVISLVFCLLISGVQSVYATDADFGKLQGQAVTGDANAQYELAGHYYKGDGVRKDYDAAFAWYKKAADQGHEEAQHQLGHIYEYGVGIINKDKKQAFEWYLKGAEGGYLASQTKVAMMYMMGAGVKQSKEKYKFWSNRVLESKGLVEITEKKAAPAKKAKPPARPVNRQAITKPAITITEPKPKPKPKPTISAPAATTPAPAKPVAVVAPKRTPEQEKAWRREQAKRLVEESNRKAAETGDWTDEE